MILKAVSTIRLDHRQPYQKPAKCKPAHSIADTRIPKAYCLLLVNAVGFLPSNLRPSQSKNTAGKFDSTKWYSVALLADSKKDEINTYKAHSLTRKKKGSTHQQYCIYHFLYLKTKKQRIIKPHS